MLAKIILTQLQHSSNLDEALDQLIREATQAQSDMYAFKAALRRWKIRGDIKEDDFFKEMEKLCDSGLDEWFFRLKFKA